MKIEKLLKRLKIEFFKVNLIQASLDSIIFFLTSSLFLFLIDQRLIESVENYVIVTPLTLLFFGADLVYRIRNYHLEIYEEENPELKEVLRTARDNLDKTNIASQALFDDVIARARSVTSESIIPSKSIIQKIIAIGILSTLVVVSGLTDFQLQRQGATILQTPDFLDEDGSRNSSLENVSRLNSSEIFGQPVNIDLEDRQLDFSVSGSGESSETSFSFDAASEEFALESSRQQPPEDMELAKRYSLAIKDME